MNIYSDVIMIFFICIISGQKLYFGSEEDDQASYFLTVLWQELENITLKKIFESYTKEIINNSLINNNSKYLGSLEDIILHAKCNV